MAQRDYFEDLLRYYEFQTGPIPNRQRLKQGLQQTITEAEVKVLMLLPFAGPMKPEKLTRKARQKLGLAPEKLQPLLDHLHKEAFVMRYDRPDGAVYERAFSSFMAEQQVRMRQGTPLGEIYAAYWNDLSTLSIDRLPTRTPYFRVMAVEETITGKSRQIVSINEPIADTRQVLPVDIITEMVRKEPLIAVAECYCRLSQGMLGHQCSYPRETCFTFNELAQDLIEIGLARRVEADEAVQILRNAEKAGLIHNADNCADHLKALCNCCPCCCPAVKAYDRGIKNVGAPSRFLAAHDPGLCQLCQVCINTCPVHAISLADDQLTFDAERCIGCGLCASACPEGAIRMVARANPPRVEATNDALWAKIRREALVGMVTSKLLGKK